MVAPTAAYPNLVPGGYNLRSPSASLSARSVHSGGGSPVPGTVGTDGWAGTNATPSATETYMVEIFVPHTCLVKGIAIKNGATVGTDKAVAALIDSQGNVLANSAVAGATTSGASAYQPLDFSPGPVQLRPGVYYIAVQFNGTTTRFATHVIGKFGAGKQTGTVFGTLTGLTPPITFTTNLGPMASLY